MYRKRYAYFQLHLQRGILFIGEKTQIAPRGKTLIHCLYKVAYQVTD
jgi:hypothetical protein